MGRVAVMELLVGDSGLQGMGIDEDKIWPNFALDAAPPVGVFLVLRWGAEQARFGEPGGKRDLNVWAYRKRTLGTDYLPLDEALRRVTFLFTSTVQFEGSDGSVLVTADYQGMSEDLIDNGYDAIAKNARFVVLCREP